MSFLQYPNDPVLASGSPNNPGGSLPQLVLTQTNSDNFNRANSNIPGSNNWIATSEAGTMTIVSNQASSPATLNQPAGILRTNESYNSNQYSQVDVPNTTLPSGTYIGVSVRNQDNANNYEAIYFNNAGNYIVQLYKKVAGAATQIGNNAVIGATPPAQPFSLLLIVEGNVIQIRMVTAGVVTGTMVAMDSTFTGGVPGVVCFTGGTGPAVVDNWVGGNAATGAVGAALATDNFNRADGNVSVGSGGKWVLMNYPNATATVEIPIVSQQLSVQNPPITAHAGNVRTDSYNSDQWSEMQEGTVDMSNAGFVMPSVRNQGSGATLGNSGYIGGGFQNATYQIYRLDNGTSTQLWVATSLPGLVADPAGTRYRLVVKGNRLSFRLQDSEIGSAVDSTYTGGAPGMMMFPNATADNWSGGNV